MNHILLDHHSQYIQLDNLKRLLMWTSWWIYSDMFEMELDTFLGDNYIHHPLSRNQNDMNCILLDHHIQRIQLGNLLKVNIIVKLLNILWHVWDAVGYFPWGQLHSSPSFKKSEWHELHLSWSSHSLHPIGQS